MSYVVRGRVARPAGPAWNLTKTLIQLSLFWAFFLWFVPGTVNLYERHYGFGAFDPGAFTKTAAFFLPRRTGYASLCESTSEEETWTA